MKDKGCDHCLDSNGENCYPHYGLALHRHNISIREGCFIGSTVMCSQEPLPANFSPDPENENFGTYEFCPYCGGASMDRY